VRAWTLGSGSRGNAILLESDGTRVLVDAGYPPRTLARRLAAIVDDYVNSDRAAMPHEEAVRDLLRESGHDFEVADVTGVPWIEIDFPADVARATQAILPRL
jgi:hypothetical protein